MDVVDHVDRRADVEAWLAERRVSWTFHAALPVADVDQLGGLQNQARLEPLAEDVVDRYAADMERGDAFPPILVRRVGKRLVPIGGNHRLAAAKQAGRPALPAYEVEAEPEMALRLSYEDNRRHGLPPSEDERITQAVHLVATGYTHEQAADVVGIHKSRLGRALAQAQADERAMRLGVKGWGLLPKVARSRFANVRSDPVFREAAQLAVDTKMTSEAVYRLVTRLNEARSDTEAMEVVGMEAEQRQAEAQQTAGGLVRKATARSRLLTSLGGVISADPKAVLAACATDDQRRALLARIQASSRRLEEIHKALRK